MTLAVRCGFLTPVSGTCRTLRADERGRPDDRSLSPVRRRRRRRRSRRCCGATATIRRSARRRRSASATRSGPTPSSSPSRVAGPTCSARLLPEGAPPHVGVLLDNTPDYLFAFGGAALAGAAIVGLNHTRQGEHLLRDVTHTDVGDVDHRARPPRRRRGRSLDGLPFGEDRIFVSRRFPRADGRPTTTLGSRPRDRARADVSADDPGIEPDPTTRGRSIFTSGTSSAPKAVICSQRRILMTGTRMRDDPRRRRRRRRLRLHAAVPLERAHGRLGAVARVRLRGRAWAGSSARRAGCPTSAATARPTSTTRASRLSYIVATPERPDDADNTLAHRVRQRGLARGASRRSPPVRRRGDRRVRRDRGRHRAQPRRARREAGCDGHRRADTSRSWTRTATELPVGRVRRRRPARQRRGVRRRDREHRRRRSVRGLLQQPRGHRSATTRNGWYWRGDLGYLDDDRYLYFAGRNADWIRVDGENFPAGPIEDALARHPDVVLAAVYGVPDEQAGDQVMAALVLRDGRDVRPGGVRRAGSTRSTDVGPEVAAALRAGGGRAADDGHEQGREAHAGAPEVPARPRRRRPRCWCATAAPTPTAVRRRRRDRAPRARSRRAGRERFWDL